MRLPVRVTLSLLAAAAVAGAAGCAGEEGGSGAGTSTTDASEIDAVLLGADSWTLLGGAGAPVITGGAPVTLSFGDGLTSASGQGPCNTYSGPVVRTGADGIRFARPRTTLIACEGAAGTAEGEYLRALEAVRTIRDAGEGEITLAGDGVRLSYRALSLPEALLGKWEVTGYRSSTESLRSVLPDTAPVLVFGDEGSVALQGCNTFRSTWTLAGNGLSVAPGATTKRLCVEPDGVMEQDAALVASIEASATVEVTPAALTIRDAGDGMVITAARP